MKQLKQVKIMKINWHTMIGMFVAGLVAVALSMLLSCTTTRYISVSPTGDTTYYKRQYYNYWHGSYMYNPYYYNYNPYYYYRPYYYTPRYYIVPKQPVVRPSTPNRRTETIPTTPSRRQPNTNTPRR